MHCGVTPCWRICRENRHNRRARLSRNTWFITRQTATYKEECPRIFPTKDINKERAREKRSGLSFFHPYRFKEKALIGFRVDGRSMQLPLGNRHGWANVWGRTLGFPLRFPERRGESCIRPLCPKVAAPPRYFVYFPLGFANGSSFKGASLMQGHASLV